MPLGLEQLMGTWGGHDSLGSESPRGQHHVETMTGSMKAGITLRAGCIWLGIGLSLA
jgi:hypothetical protein